MEVFSIFKKLLAISIVLILLSLSTVAASDDSQSIAIGENSDIQVPDTLLSSASDVSDVSVNDDLISADAGDESNGTGIYAVSEDLVNDLNSDEKEMPSMQVSSDKDVIYAGEKTTITVTLPEDATGMVSIDLWFVNVTKTGGVASYDYSSKSVGNHTVTVIYYGDSKYNFAMGSVNVTVLEAPPKENVTMEISAVPDEIFPGEDTTITVTLPEDATGFVTIGLNLVNVTDGVAVANITGLIRGNYTVPVIYYGDDKYNYAIGSVNITVLKTPPKENATMTITANPNVVYVGEKFTFTVTLPEDATGFVTVGHTIVNVTDGVASLDAVAVIPGNHTSIVIYYGDDKYNYAVGYVNVTVLKVPKENVTMEITADPAEIYPGEDTTITVTLPEDATGFVTIGLNLVNVTDGVAVANITGLIRGNYTVPVIYYGDDKYNYAIGSVNITVLKTPPKENATMTITANPNVVYVGENFTFTVTLPEDATGFVTIGFNLVNVTDGVASLDAVALIPGNHTETVIYYGDDKYNYAVGSVNVTVLKVPKENVTMDVTAVPAEIFPGEDTTITVTLPEDATGIVSIGLWFVNVTDGVAVANFSALLPGTSTLPVIYYGNEKYNYAVGSVNVTVLDPKKNVTMEITANPNVVYVGENFTFTVTLPEDATGFVTIGHTIVNVTNGVASFDATAVIPGNHTSIVIYYGDDNYHYAIGSVNVTVLKVPKENVTMEITADPAEIYPGENTTITVTLPEDATGIVSIGLWFVKVIDGVAVVNFTSLIPDTSTLPVIYYGNEKYNYAIGSVNLTALDPKKNVTMEITAVPDEVYVGELVTVTVTLPEDATGFVTVGHNLVNVTDGVASLDAVALIPGVNRTIPVIYYGDDKYHYAIGSFNITVLKVPKENVTMEITADPAEIYPGENTTITVILPEDATGIVSIGLWFVNVTDGVAVVNFTSLIPDTSTLPVIYYGNEKYNYAIGSVNVTALNPKKNVTMEITVNPEVIYVGENATVTVTLPEDAAGIVSIGLTFVDVVNGTATASVPGLVKGNITVPVIYYGDKNYKMASDSVNVTILSAKKDPEMNVTADKDIIVIRENVTFVVELPEDATGKVSIGLKLVNVTNGTATATITSIIPGKIPVPVIYYGDDNYIASMKIYNLTVKTQKDDVIIAPDVNKYYKGPERLVIDVTDYQGNPLANKTVEILINNVTYIRTTDENGTASMALGLNSGVYNVTTTVDNQTVGSVVTILPTVNGTDVVKVFRNATQYYATFFDTEGNYLPDGTEVTFNINGVMYKRFINGTEGKARLNINLPQGEYIITAINPINDEMAANNITVLPSITNNENLVKLYRNDSQYYVTVIGDDGNPVGAGVNVTFNINGVFYTRQTNESGVARLNINLQPGEYIITAEYNECRVSNNITVLPVLSASDLTKKYGSSAQFVANLVDGQGNPYANQKIEFNINGVFYYRTTNSTGQAALNINLMPGEYIITSSYNDANIANTVKVEA